MGKYKLYTVISDHDGNDTFGVEAKNYNEAAHLALYALGWWIAERTTEGQDENE